MTKAEFAAKVAWYERKSLLASNSGADRAAACYDQALERLKAHYAPCRHCGETGLTE